MAVFSGLYESPGPPPSGGAHGIVPPHRDHHQNSHQSGYILHYFCVDCCPAGRRGETVRILAQWWRPVAYFEALNLCYRAMRSVLHQRIWKTIETAKDGGHRFHRH